MDTHKVKGTSCVYKQAFGCVMIQLLFFTRKYYTIGHKWNFPQRKYYSARNSLD